MIWAGLVVLWTIAGISYGQNATSYFPFCDKSGTNYTFTLLVEIKDGDPFKYITFDDSVGTELIPTCSTTNGQITGSGNSTDPYRISILVQSTVDINLGSPDCGHVAAGDVLNWTVHLVQTLPPPPPIGGANGLESTQVFSCDFGAIPDNPTLNISIDRNDTTLENLTTTIVLTQVTRDVSMYMSKARNPILAPTVAGGTQVEVTWDVGTAGVYAYNVIACNTAYCDDLILPMIDADGCRIPNSIYEDLVVATAPDTGTLMFDFPPGHPLESFNIPGKAFTETFTMFRFIRSPEVFFRANIGYCDSRYELKCTQHCFYVRNLRKKRAAPSPNHIDRNADHMTVAFTVEGSLVVIGYPSSVNRTIFREPDAESCMDKPGFIAVLALLGTSALVSVIVALGFGLRLSSESGKICGYW